MINMLKIERFKSIKLLQLDCRRVNLFIGEPNVGKSNILEVIGLLSWLGAPVAELKNYVRFQLAQNLFYDGIMDDPVRIEWQGDPSDCITVRFRQNLFVIQREDPPGEQIAVIRYDGAVHGGVNRLPLAEVFRFYRFQLADKFESDSPSALIPPHGPNLFSVVYASKALRERMAGLFRSYGLKLVMKPHEKHFELQKEADGIVTAVPYSMVSDTLQRVIFYSVAIASNKNAILAFEEPEAHAFPFFTKHLGETIAMDESNQYFIATHNPYLLNAVVEKAKKADVCVFLTYFRDYETRVKPVTDDALSKLLDADPFLSIESLLSEEATA